MRILYRFTWVALGLLPVFAVAQNGSNSAPAYYLSSRDSLLLTVENGRKFVHHTVRPKQTLFSLARFYGINLDELFEYNPIFRQEPVLRIGEQVKIPVPNMAIKRYKSKTFVASKHAPVFYVVQDGDNLFQICKRYFDMPVDTIARRNRLKDRNIRPGQLLLMGWMSIEGIPHEWRPERPETPPDIMKARFEAARTGKNEHSTQGVCFWQKDSKENGEAYALHREALIGSIIAVTNPMTNRTIHAKVIGRIPESYGRNIEIILAPSAARRLGARDPRFFVKLRYFK